jgi:CDP-glycerol glycerophosphotransferase (TagB/SpsB family)
MKILIFFIGFLLKPFFKYASVKNIWVFGSQHGTAFLDNSKYFFEYIVANHSEKNPIWITQSKKVYSMLKQMDLPVEMNVSIRGMWLIAKAEKVILSTSRNDILYVFPKKGRKIVELWHGMPMKKILYDHEPHRPENKNLKGKIWDRFVAGFQFNQVDFIASTSDFFVDILKSSFRNENVYVTGQARTDSFFNWDEEEIRKKLGFTREEKIVTYMPTHRAYGQGKLNPKIFLGNNEAIRQFQEQNVTIVLKFHKNMLSIYEPSDSLQSCIRDLTAQNVDPQELLFISDILVTDYSSCYIDYLLLKRPVIFYLYDNYEEDDNELYYEPHSHNVGPIVRCEEDLLKQILNFNFTEKPSVEYHKYCDGNSCKRSFDIIDTL